MRDLLSEKWRLTLPLKPNSLISLPRCARYGSIAPNRLIRALTRTMLQQEELESRVAEYDSLLDKLNEKRESLYAAFETKRQHGRNTSTASRLPCIAANRVHEGISKRTERIDSPEELRFVSASDPMVDKVRRIAGNCAISAIRCAWRTSSQTQNDRR